MLVGEDPIHDDLIGGGRLAAAGDIPRTATEGGVVPDEARDFLSVVQLEDGALHHDRDRPRDVRVRAKCIEDIGRQERAGACERPDALLGDHGRTGRVLEVRRRLAVNAGQVAREEEDEHDREGNPGDAQEEPDSIVG